MSDTIVLIQKQLDGEAEQLRLQIDDLESRAAIAHEELRRLTTARSALDGKSPLGKQTRKRVSSGKPAPTRDKVAELMVAILNQNGTLSSDDLKAAVAAKLVEEGFSKVGFSLRYKEVLESDQFARRPAIGSEA